MSTPGHPAVGAALRGALMVCGTTSDAGKTTVVTGLCRLLARRGIKVAPFKAQNMALNSAVTATGHEIGRAQVAQAQAAGVEPEVAMNPILLKPTSDRTSQVIVEGRPWAVLDAAAYHRAKPQLLDLVLSNLADLRSRYDVVLCEGAGSPTEINLLDADIVNLRVAARAGMKAIVVGDIDRGGVFAALYGTVALLPDEGFVINKFRGDPALLGSGLDQLQDRCGVPTLGVLPWADGIGLDAEDSLALSHPAGAIGAVPLSHPAAAVDAVPLSDPAAAVDADPLSHPVAAASAAATLDVAAVRFPRVSNFTDLDPLAAEPGVSLRWVEDARALGRPDLIVLPGSKATVTDLAWLRRVGLAQAIVERVGGGVTTVLGICGGYQMLGRGIVDPVEARLAHSVEGLGLLPTTTRFDAEKVLRQRSGTGWRHPVGGYQIHHGRTTLHADQAVGPPAQPWLILDGEGEGAATLDGAVLGTSLHGLLESDGFRGELLGRVAERAGTTWPASTVSFPRLREERFDRLADLLEAHLDLRAIERLITKGVTC
jgi:adenosylcobyric acid synthase